MPYIVYFLILYSTLGYRKFKFMLLLHFLYYQILLFTINFFKFELINKTKIQIYQTIEFLFEKLFRRDFAIIANINSPIISILFRKKKSKDYLIH